MECDLAQRTRLRALLEELDSRRTRGRRKVLVVAGAAGERGVHGVSPARQTELRADCMEALEAAASSSKATAAASPSALPGRAGARRDEVGRGRRAQHAYPRQLHQPHLVSLLNDQAIAAQYLIDNNKAKQILILDLDVHQGNGTAAIFKNNTSIFTCSVHGAKNYPFRKEESDLDIGLEDQTADKDYLAKLKKLLPQLLDQIQPDFIFYLCGVDILGTDKLGRLNLSLEGCRSRDQLVFETCHHRGIPLQCSMGGGYSKDINIIIEAHANTYREAAKLYF